MIKKITQGYVEQEFDDAGSWISSRFVENGEVYYRDNDGRLTYDEAKYQSFDMLQPNDPMTGKPAYPKS